MGPHRNGLSLFSSKMINIFKELLKFLKASRNEDFYQKQKKKKHNLRQRKAPLRHLDFGGRPCTNRRTL